MYLQRQGKGRIEGDTEIEAERERKRKRKSGKKHRKGILLLNQSAALVFE